MRTRFSVLIAVLVCILLSSMVAFGQQRFDPKDLSGYWLRNTVRPKDHPPLTPAGVAAMKGRVPDDDTRLPNESNDPMYRCNPQGFPRLMWEENEPLEIIMTPNRILRLFQWERRPLEIWMDGRALPSGETLDSIGPNWYGHSVGRWEGNTLVVLTTGVEERAWLDEYGNPKSYDAVFEERFTRTGPDTIEGQLTINDPKMFTATWIHPKSTFTRMKPEATEFFGWKGLFSGLTEAICAPMNELDDFNKRIRDPGIFGK